MGGFVDTWEIKVLDHFIGNIPTTTPATYYIGLSTTTINATGGNVTEPSGGAYARVASVNNSSNWPSGNPKINGVTITFPKATASWGQIVDFFLTTHLTTSGLVVAWGTLTTPYTVPSGHTASFGVGALRIRMVNP